MSEPVGNAARGPAIPGNSHKDRQTTEAATPTEEPREQLTKVVEGKVVSKKPAWWKRATKSIVMADATSVREFIVTDVIVPSIRNLIRDVAVGSIDRSLYGTSARRGIASGIAGRGSQGPVSSLRSRYDQMAEERMPPRGLTSQQRATHDFNQITLDDREEAVAVIEALISQVIRYGSATVSDLYDLVGVTGSFADQRWGWKDLATADIRPNRGGWLLDLPAPEPLR